MPDSPSLRSTYRAVKLPEQRWRIAAAQPQKVAMLAGRTGLDPLLAQVLLNRGIETAAEAEVFIDPEKQILPTPLNEFPDLRVAIELLMEAIAYQHKIAICGDYDADGMTSTALLLRALRSLGARVDYAIPSRMSEGYGINNRIVEEFCAEGVRLILTVDNGIAAFAPIARARELGMVVIVTDHHDIPPELPPANAILNPKLISQDSPYWGVAGVGVAYILAVSLAQNLGQMQDLTKPLLELFTLGTIADLAPLIGVNRRWVRRGLSLLPRSQLAGVQALIQVAGLGNEKEALKPEAIGFRLGPRINAVGRIADPQIVIELLTTDDPGVALAQAMQCEQVNQMRQRLCELIEQEAIAWCEQNQFDLQDDRVLLVVHPGWHHGVIGIVASRLVERYGVPVFIGTYEDEEQHEIRGSARGIPEFNVFEALQCCGELLEKFGGHKAAGGFTLKAENLQEMRSRLRIFANLHLKPQHLKPLVNVDVQASLRNLDLDLYEQIDHLHPCGIDNPDPVFWTPNVRVVEQNTIGRDRNHLKVVVAEADEDIGIKAIAWRWGEYFPLPDRVDVAYRLRLNEWNGTRSVELELVGIRLPDSEADVSTTNSPELKATPTEPVAPPCKAAKVAPLPAVSSEVIEEIVEEILEEASQKDSVDGISDEETDGSEMDLSDQSEPLPKAEFYYNSRKYTCSLAVMDNVRELRIRNPDGMVLAVHPHQKQGLLGKRREEAQEVDIAHPHFYNLIRAALNALQIADLSELLKKKDRLLKEKDEQIDNLQQQIELLQQQLNQLTAEQQKHLETLQTDIQQRELAIQQHETQIVKLQEQIQQTTPEVDEDEIKRSLKKQLGNSVWFCLDQRSQKDLIAAYKNDFLIRADDFTADSSDYSEAGIRMGFVAEREVVQPFFKSLHEFLINNGRSDEIAGLILSNKKRFTLGMMPALIAEQWTTFKEPALKKRSQSNDAELFGVVSFGQQVSGSDRTQIQKFLQSWEHPLGTWLLNNPTEAASNIDQVNKLRNISAHAEDILHRWQFDFMAAMIVGDEEQRGVLQQIFGSNKRP